MILCGSGNTIILALNGREWPLPQQSFVSLRFQRAVNLSVPIVELVINDEQDWLRTNNIVDGTLLTVMLAIDFNAYQYDFVITDIVKDQGKENKTTIVGLLAKPKWFRGVCQPFYGTSYEAIKHIAEECDYTFTSNISVTDDAKLWTGNLTNYGMAMEIASRGYVNEKSCMVLACGLEGIAYNNIFEEINWDKAKNFVQQPKSNSDIVTVKTALVKSGAGSQMIYTYPIMLVSQGLKENNIIEQTTFSKDFSEVLPVGVYVKDKLDFTRREIYPLDIGNNHKNEPQAYYQNLKRKAMFLDTVVVYCNHFKTVSLLEPVKVDYNGQATRGIVSSIITTFDSANQQISTRVDVSTTNANMKE